jgi:glucans biosynthesis protein
MNRTRAVAALAAAGLVPAAASCEPREALAADRSRLFEDVAAEARRRAAAPYAETTASELPPALRGLDYDAWRRIRFRLDAPPWQWSRTRARIRLHPLGHLFTRPVDVHVVGLGGAQAVRFSPGEFDGLAGEASDGAGAGVAGAGIELVGRGGGEYLTFLGASYFRGRARDDASYGASARGLGVGIGSPTEEFPAFRALWFVEPEREGDAVTVVALLDSPSVAGAYRFDVLPGSPTVVGVEARLFPRTDAAFDVAPITSMFLRGEAGPPAADHRPEVHDSDGLLLADGTGEWIWRPLRNPVDVSLCAFRLRSPRGFGLLQRDRDFDHYQDLEARYHRRPSVWVVPRGDWGEGAVRLLEIPAATEAVDNVAAAWRPDRQPRPGEELRLSYELRFGGPDPAAHGGGRVIATRTASRPDGGARLFVDFAGGRLDAATPDRSPRASVTVSDGRAGNPVVERVEETGAWRAFFDVDAEPGRTAELRVFLEGSSALTETWSCPWTR